MNKINRNKKSKPDCLDKNSQIWTDDFILKRQKKTKYWNWHKYKNEKVENILSEKLSKLTDYHCAYCGIYPLKQKVGGRSIDHFKPKANYPDLAFEWTNLFIACPDCQKIKGSNFPNNVEPLKPDSCHYHFDYWFKINWVNNHIEPNPKRNQREQEIARETINWLGLNEGERPQERYVELEKYMDSSITDISKWSYPYFLERAEKLA